jgi:hypothetical protein
MSQKVVPHFATWVQKNLTPNTTLPPPTPTVPSPFFTVYRRSDRKLRHFPRRRRSVRRAYSVRLSLRQLWSAKDDILLLTARKLSAAAAVKNI